MTKNVDAANDNDAPSMDPETIAAAREKLRQKLGGIPQRSRGMARTAALRPANIAANKGSESDKHKAVLKKLNLQPLGFVESVKLLKDSDQSALYFGKGVKVQVDPHSNCTVVTGVPQVKTRDELVTEFLARISTTLKHPGGAQVDPAGAEDDDDVPALVEDFESHARAGEEIKIEEVAENEPVTATQ